MESIAQLFRDLETPLKQSLQSLFLRAMSFPLANALLEGSEICEDSLPSFTGDVVLAQSLSLTLTLQLDNACGNNKNRFVFAFCSLLVHREVFREIFINFVIVGHTHEDIE